MPRYKTSSSKNTAASLNNNVTQAGTTTKNPSSNFNKHTKEFFRLCLIISLVVVKASSSSIFNNNLRYYNRYHRGSAGRRAASQTCKKRDLNTINSWNVRSLSSLQLSAQPPNPSTTSIGAASATPAASFYGIHDVASVSTTNNVRSRWGIGGRGRGRRRQQRYHNSNDDILNNQLVSSQGVGSIGGDGYSEERPLTPAEMKSQLGPIGLLIANSVEVGLATANSYISTGIFGYFVGGCLGVPGMFKSSPQDALNNAGAIKKMQQKMGDLNAKALTQGKSWGALSASFSGFHALARVCRGGVEDRWNSIISSACAGAYLSRKAGPQAMLSAASTYATMTYIFDLAMGGLGGKTTNQVDKDFDFTDTPIEDRGF